MSSFTETLIDPRFRYGDVLFHIVLFLGRRVSFVTEDFVVKGFVISRFHCINILLNEQILPCTTNRLVMKKKGDSETNGTIDER